MAREDLLVGQIGVEQRVELGGAYLLGIRPAGQRLQRFRDAALAAQERAELARRARLAGRQLTRASQRILGFVEAAEAAQHETVVEPRARIVRAQLEHHLQLGRGFLALAERIEHVRERDACLREVGLCAQRCAQQADRGARRAARLRDVREVVVGEGIGRVEREHRLISILGAAEIALRFEGGAEVQVRGRVQRIRRDRLPVERASVCDASLLLGAVTCRDQIS